MPDKIYIKYLPKDKLLYYLWRGARLSTYFVYCNDKIPILTLSKARRDINYMLQNKSDIKLTTYYGRPLFINISTHWISSDDYNIYNGKNTLERIVKRIKLEEMQKSILRYYIQ